MLSFFSVLCLIILFLAFVFIFLSYKRFKNLGFLMFLKSYASNIKGLFKNPPNFWSILNYIKRYYNEKKWLYLLVKRAKNENKIQKNKLETIIKSLTGIKEKILDSTPIKKINFHLKGILFLQSVKNKNKYTDLSLLIPLKLIKADKNFSLKQHIPEIYSHNFLIIDKIQPPSPILNQLLTYFDYVLILNNDKKKNSISQALQKKYHLKSYKLDKNKDILFYVKNHIATYSKLGYAGEFGNQILQYLFLKNFSLLTQSRTQCSPWLGQQIFNNCEAIPEKVLPISYIHQEFKEIKNFPIKHINHDFGGFYNFKTDYFIKHRDYLLSQFSFQKEHMEEFSPGLKKLQSMGKIIIGIHLRISQIDTHIEYFKPTPMDVYIDWLESIWKKAKDPVLFIASDVIQNAVKVFKKFNPVTSKSLGLHHKIQYLPDYYLLTHTDIMAISNSTFSFTASLFNKKGKSFYRPNKLRNGLEQYKPWNTIPHPPSAYKL